ncbi:relaxase/mobilization nuclease domain-containing protein [Tetragenococcus halophilus]|uniref:Relaxase/mobilization nuclease domain-containing protein n=2 Tax=Tetragenococcus halophilus TaxID=51669 RepID=A0AB35HTP2_TETHA|nr:relaxase/mobilization nuclease domain-containing protein [Tetragenococcus halophilus]MDN6717739.1 relaxase/mobilization nuclease domain-containing protein [Lactococcus lactis]MCF1676617.1 relaxase/mobilization nuclease domain-containing protein [Tetragenococcus halophilus]MCO8296775.1 relaxase/mobilization nuclease domain-containing protein [Tetragenococcus halophilus]MCO8299169.1 relaxase/mobilization nuclease domain-containing protein [Tetragenococcus halophilus]MDN6724035.1 relaxase/mobi
MATTHIKRSNSASRLINYAEKRAVLKDGLNLDIDYAKSELKQVREIYGNTGKTQAYASRIAFSPKEFDPQNETDQQKALDIAKEVYEKTYPNQQVALYEHIDTDSLHIHAVVGAIDLESGKKMHGNWHEFRDRLVHNTDEIVEQHGLEVTQSDPNRTEKHSMAEIKMTERGQPTWKDQIRQSVDETMGNPLIRDFQAFREDLRQKAIDVWERGKNLTYQLIGTNYKTRGTKLGTDYEKETIYHELERRQQQSQETNRETSTPDTARTNPAKPDVDRTSELSRNTDSATINSQNSAGPTTETNRTNQPRSQSSLSNDLDQLVAKQREEQQTVGTDLTKRLRPISKADRNAQSEDRRSAEQDKQQPEKQQRNLEKSQQPTRKERERHDGPSR